MEYRWLTLDSEIHLIILIVNFRFCEKKDSADFQMLRPVYLANQGAKTFMFFRIFASCFVVFCCWARVCVL